MVITKNIPKKLKMNGINDVLIELIDYRGEHLDTVAELCLYDEKLEKKVLNLKEELKDKTDDKTLDKIEEDIKSGKFRRFTKYMPKNKWKEVDVSLIGPLYLYSRIKSADNLIFLIDGKKLLEFIIDRNSKLSIIKNHDPVFYEKIKSEKTWDQDLLDDLSNYAAIMDELVSTNKRVYFAITKSDVIVDAFQRALELSGEDDLVDYEDVKEEIIETLLKYDIVRDICNKMFGGDVDIEIIKGRFYMVSVRPNDAPRGIKEMLMGILNK
jgi:hypothetical protein